MEACMPILLSSLFFLGVFSRIGLFIRACNTRINFAVMRINKRDSEAVPVKLTRKQRIWMQEQLWKI